MKSAPLISIIMPVYNDHEYLSGALNSILNQTYTNWELIAIDDASTDSSHLILSSFALLDSRIKVYKNDKNVGVGKTLDRGVGLAIGKYIARMDADDISYPKRLEKQVEFLTHNPEVVAVGGQVRLINEWGKGIGTKLFPLENKDLYEMLYYAVPIQHPTLMVNTRLLPKDFTWYDGWSKAQDLYLYFKLVKLGKLANLPDFLLEYRYYSGGNSLADPRDTFRKTKAIRAIAVTKFGYIPTLKGRVLSALQTTVILLPNFLILPIYKFIRGLSIFAEYTISTKAQVVVTGLEKATSNARETINSLVEK